MQMAITAADPLTLHLLTKAEETLHEYKTC